MSSLCCANHSRVFIAKSALVVSLLMSDAACCCNPYCCRIGANALVTIPRPISAMIRNGIAIFAVVFILFNHFYWVRCSSRSSAVTVARSACSAFLTAFLVSSAAFSSSCSAIVIAAWSLILLSVCFLMSFLMLVRLNSVPVVSYVIGIELLSLNYYKPNLSSKKKYNQ